MARANAAAPALLRLTCAGLATLGEPALLAQQQTLAAALQSGGAAAAVAAAAAARSALGRPWAGVASRPLSGVAGGEQAAADKGGRAARRAAAAEKAAVVSGASDRHSAITDQIPQRPVSATEAGGYSLVIVAALGFAGAVAYAAVNELVLQPQEYKCFNHTLTKIKDDPRVTVRLGSPVTGYGQESANRAARQRIPHRLYDDEAGRQHVQLQFQLRGPGGRATVNADMHQEGGKWRYNFLYLNVEAPVPQQVVLVRPGQEDTDY
ncbi:hypothetical protein D9Q98_002452 [Chlorella vulgaris]|uniref:Mitochondrial import inner membrane translocase subunit Tim21 n=1 Tax=Chlorella vulgaris TaxID=3077 RepID=A0A9D4TT87_CHLVU|nr:hypothetical protein D9Q98_002452 [Chlorella vulgaris]